MKKYIIATTIFILFLILGMQLLQSESLLHEEFYSSPLISRLLKLIRYENPQQAMTDIEQTDFFDGAQNYDVQTFQQNQQVFFVDPEKNQSFEKQDLQAERIMPEIDVLVLPSAVHKITLEKLTENENKNGIYPVKLFWEPVEQAQTYDVYRSLYADNDFQKINTLPIIGTDFIDSTETTIGTYYYYKVLARNANGEGDFFDDSAVIKGYGLLCPEAFYNGVEKTIISSHRKLTLMHKANNLQKIGKEETVGTYSGTLAYSCQVIGLGARVIMQYSNYCDFYNAQNEPLIILDNNTNTSVNLKANGTMDGIIQVSGMYSGTVNYGNIQITSGIATNGNYEVTVNSTDKDIVKLIPHKIETARYFQTLP